MLKYNDEVRIISGFYQGLEGKLVGVEDELSPPAKYFVEILDSEGDSEAFAEVFEKQIVKIQRG